VLTATAAVVRSELVLLLAPIVVILLASRRISVSKALSYGALGGFGGMGESLAFRIQVSKGRADDTLLGSSCDGCGRLCLLVAALPLARAVHNLLQRHPRQSFRVGGQSYGGSIGGLVHDS
jgi:hypothetical protein